jgi:hypothetical protein
MSSTSPFFEAHTVEFMVFLASRRVTEAVEGDGAAGRVASGTYNAWRMLARKAAVLALATMRSLLGSIPARFRSRIFLPIYVQ